MEKWSDDDLKLYKKLEGIVSRGYYVSGTELADLHNRVFDTKLSPTGCTSCNRMRFNALKKSYENLMVKLNNEEGKK